MVNTLEEVHSGAAHPQGQPHTFASDRPRAVADMARLLRSGRQLLCGIEADMIRLTHHATSLKVQDTQQDIHTGGSQGSQGEARWRQGPQAGTTLARPASVVKAGLVEPIGLLSQAFESVYKRMSKHYLGN